MTKEIAVIGAGGHARSVISLVELLGYTISGIYDDSWVEEKREVIFDYPLIGKIEHLSSNQQVVLAIGDSQLREELFIRLGSQVLPNTLIHPSAIVEKRVDVGSSNLIFAQANVNAGARLGVNNIINSCSILEHEVHIGDHTHISVGSVIAGRSQVGSNCLLGAGAVVIDKITVANHVIIGAQAVVIDSITEPGTYVGNPARKIK